MYMSDCICQILLGQSHDYPCPSNNHELVKWTDLQENSREIEIMTIWLMASLSIMAVPIIELLRLTIVNECGSDLTVLQIMPFLNSIEPRIHSIRLHTVVLGSSIRLQESHFLGHPQVQSLASVSSFTDRASECQ